VRSKHDRTFRASNLNKFNSLGEPIQNREESQFVGDAYNSHYGSGVVRSITDK
jgi:hypothetical protein